MARHVRPAGADGRAVLNRLVLVQWVDMHTRRSRWADLGELRREEETCEGWSCGWVVRATRRWITLCQNVALLPGDLPDASNLISIPRGNVLRVEILGGPSLED